MVLLEPLKQPEVSLYWTARLADDSDFSPEDPLALDYLAQQVGLWLFPTLTTRTSRAQYYAVVLYGLHLVERTIEKHALPADDNTRTQLFEQWERFWALALMESLGGALGRGNPDTIRGVRGLKRAWSPGDAPLRLDFPLISRQSELGALGAYLNSLRDIGLVIAGTLRPSPAARAILEAFWDEPDASARSSRYEAYALTALDPTLKKRVIDRKYTGLTLAAVGERSRLSCLVGRQRTVQQTRLYDTLFTRARDPITLPCSELIRRAAKDQVTDPEQVLANALAGTWGSVEATLREHLVLALTFGRAFREILTCFNAAYGAATDNGWMASRRLLVGAAFPPVAHDTLRKACSELLDSPLAARLKQLPVHGAAFLSLVAQLRDAPRDQALVHLLSYHLRVQQERGHGGSWLREDGDKVVVVRTSYTGHLANVGFPPLKIPIVRSLLIDMGRCS
ncbi:hypothetical protein [Chondromyces crocatus]|nr:hypothetical protein [Chondromyces crocatus]AKT41237.1 uncharacterized protein CMC5_053980 [Chondromyces crocatus]